MKEKLRILKEKGEIITSEKGNSMVPLIHSKQKHKLKSVKDFEECEIGDIVFCKVKGNFYTHKVVGKSIERGLLIANNKGFVNGWTKQVYGKVIEIY